MDRRSFLATGTGVAAVALAGCAVGSGSGGTADHDVGMTAARFDPPEITVTPGTTVVWKNTSSHAHTVTAYEDAIPDDATFFASGDFESQTAAEDGWQNGNGGALFEGDTFRHTFELPGSYGYFCIPHEAGGMLGSVTVRSSTTATE